ECPGAYAQSVHGAVVAATVADVPVVAAESGAAGGVRACPAGPVVAQRTDRQSPADAAIPAAGADQCPALAVAVRGAAMAASAFCGVLREVRRGCPGSAALALMRNGFSEIMRHPWQTASRKLLNSGRQKHKSTGRRRLWKLMFRFVPNRAAFASCP